MKLRITTSTDTEVRFLVEEQEYRGRDFGDGGVFCASNGLKLESDTHPAFYMSCTNTLYLWGRDKNRDDSLVIMPTRYIEGFLQAIREYNESILGKWVFMNNITIDPKLFEF